AGSAGDEPVDDVRSDEAGPARDNEGIARDLHHAAPMLAEPSGAHGRRASTAHSLPGLPQNGHGSANALAPRRPRRPAAAINAYRRLRGGQPGERRARPHGFDD